MKYIPNAISKAVAHQVLLGRKNSPTILFGAGVIGAIGSTVLACRATLQIESILHETQTDLSIVRDVVHPEYSESDRRKDITIIYARSVGKLGRLYAPSMILGVASIGCLTKSHNILQERNLALTAAYAAVDQAFKEYRAQVVKKYGEDEDRELRYNTEEVEVYDEKLGNTVKSTRIAPNEPSMYARFFDQFSTCWSKEPEYNLLFLRCQQTYANDMLKTRGHVFLNEVYDDLGLDRTKPGSVVGWILDEDSDNYIDFGIFDPNKEGSRDFVNGREGSILLDFNVDGVIFDKIENHGERLKWQS